MSMVYSQSVGVAETSRWRQLLQTVSVYVTLTKPRIMVLLLFTEYCAMVAAMHRVPDFRTTVVALLGLALSAGGSAVINMWYDRDIDAVMQRTSNRPLPMGLVQPRHAFWYGIVLGVLSVIVLALWANPLAAGLSAAGYVYYAVVYTMWLKRATPQNIVIGGGAGAFPPLVGWAAATGRLDWLAVIMFIVIFLWTPPHFWALALYKNEDYQRAGIPMMPAVRGARTTKQQMIVYALLLLASTLAPLWMDYHSWLYGSIAGGVGLLFTLCNIRLWFEPDHEFRWAKRTFLASLMYVPIMFTVLSVGALH
ncbi:MAG: heme o synthase [Alicyclobacillus sp.]|nr:heme o synthase [Alicyclobacillus sp.]